jgi:hypothetical protein
MLKNAKLEEEIDKFEGEIWLMHPIGKWVSSFGRMKHVYKSRQQVKTERITLGNITSSGYRKTDVRGKKKYVHRLVLEAFTSVDEGIDKLVDHIDRNPLNNRLENLRWVDHKENASNRRPPQKFKHCKTCSCNE